MCIYCGTTKYRKIYENHFGPIPQDDTGRTFDIHHLDKNPKNNNPDNLIALSISDHYMIHQSRGDWQACSAILRRMNINPEELSRACRELQKKAVEEGTHLFVTNNPGLDQNCKRLKNGTHNFVGGSQPIHKRVASGEHQKMVREMNNKRVREGIHHWLGTNNPVHQNIANGSHPFANKISCPHCDNVATKANAVKWHFDNCLFKDIPVDQRESYKISIKKEKRRLKKLKNLKNNPKPTIIECPHCGKIGSPCNMRRWHFQNCKVLIPQRIETKSCPHCGKNATLANLARWHFARCKSLRKCV